MRIVIEAQEAIIGAGRPGNEKYTLWEFQGSVECSDCVKPLADAAYRAAMRCLKENNGRPAGNINVQRGGGEP